MRNINRLGNSLFQVQLKMYSQLSHYSLIVKKHSPIISKFLNGCDNRLCCFLENDFLNGCDVKLTIRKLFVIFRYFK